MKKQYSTATTVVLVVLLVLVVGATGFVMSRQNIDSNPTKTNADTTKNDQATQEDVDITKNTLSTEGLKDYINNKQTGFLYIGRPTCPHCAVFTPILNEVIAEKGYKNVQFYNTDEARKVSADELTAMMNQLNVTGVPTFIYMRDGTEVGRLENISDKQALVDFMTKYQQ